VAVTTKSFFTQLLAMQKTVAFLICGKKIEIWHSLLRVHTQSDDAMAIEKGAKT